MTNMEYREEKDSMGLMQVPAWALWGASTQRAVENFPVHGRVMPPDFIHAYGLLKSVCAKVNHALGKLDARRADAIIDAANEIAQGKLDAHFPIDVFQTGSGTSTNMNVNEVIANRASQKAGKAIGSKDPLHPNDHVNLGQSSNDTFPTVIHISAALALVNKLKPALHNLHTVLNKHANDWSKVVKAGRTHLMDATPITMGQVFSGYAAQAEYASERVDRAISVLSELPIGGTAVGTGINTHPEFGTQVALGLSEATGLAFYEARNHFEAQAAKDALVETSGILKTIAVSMSKIASDIRLLGSGPRCGIAELILPATQPGSSIMPGKVNPVIAESMIQVAIRVVANDTLIAYANFGGVGSIFELNVAMPVMADAILESINLLSNATQMFVDKTLKCLKVDEHRCKQLLEQSLMMVTKLVPVVGYDSAAAIAKQALTENKSIRELVLQKNLLGEKELDELLDPLKMTFPTDERF